MIEARNEADTLAYSVEKSVTEYKVSCLLLWCVALGGDVFQLFLCDGLCCATPPHVEAAAGHMLWCRVTQFLQVETVPEGADWSAGSSAACLPFTLPHPHHHPAHEQPAHSHTLCTLPPTACAGQAAPEYCGRHQRGH